MRYQMDKDDFIEEIRADQTPIQAEENIAMLFAVVLSGIVEKVREKYGEDGETTVKQAFIDSVVNSLDGVFDQISQRNLENWKQFLLPALGVGHIGGIEKQTGKDLRFKFTGCTWAKVFTAIGKPEIGHLFCDCDEPMVKSFNNEIEFDRTKTLMDGDDHCNHRYFFK